MSVSDFREQFKKYTTLYAQRAEGKKAIDWLRRNVNKFVPRVNIQNQEFGTFARQLVPGKFYVYGYDPKWKDVLPIYDKFPYVLITSINMENFSFHGINFHYLPREVRVEIFAALYDIATSTKIPGNKKDGLIWRRVSRIAAALGNDKHLNGAIKMYLFSHVMTRFIQVPKEDWALTAFLPIARMYTNKQK